MREKPEGLSETARMHPSGCLIKINSSCLFYVQTNKEHPLNKCNFRKIHTNGTVCKRLSPNGKLFAIFTNRSEVWSSNKTWHVDHVKKMFAQAMIPGTMLTNRCYRLFFPFALSSVALCCLCREQRIKSIWWCKNIRNLVKLTCFS